MNKQVCIMIILLGIWTISIGCANHRYQTQKGAAMGAGLGAIYGQAIGRDTESTLIGTAIGGLVGAVIGNYEDQRATYQQNQANYYRQQNYQPPVRQQPARSGNRVVVPGQYVGRQYVPSHQVWLPPRQTGVVVER